MIYEDYIKETNIIDKTEEEKKAELIRSIVHAKKDYERASLNYEYAEGELIDYYLYEMKASQAKLNYLLKKAKQKNLLINMLDQIEIIKGA